MSSRAQFAGFTLVEMTLALAVLAMLSVALFASLRFGTATFDRVMGANDRASTLFASHRFVRALIESAYPMRAVANESDSSASLHGTQHAMSIIAHAPMGLASAGLLRFELATRENTTGTHLVMRAWPVVSNARQDASPTLEETLLDGVERVEFAYADTLDTAQPLNWRTEWSVTALPAAIRMRVKLKQSAQWSELVAVPRIAIDANCTFDVVAQRCRSAS